MIETLSMRLYDFNKLLTGFHKRDPQISSASLIPAVAGECWNNAFRRLGGGGNGIFGFPLFQHSNWGEADKFHPAHGINRDDAMY